MILIYIEKRYIVACLTSIGLLLLTSIQTNFALTNTLIINGKFADIHWSPVDLSYLNSLFYVGYLLSNIPSGSIVQRYSSTKIFVYPLMILFLLNTLIPLSIELRSSFFGQKLNYFILAWIRFFQGLCAGCAFPSSHGILSKWCPASERGRIGSFIYTGLYAGPILGFSLSSYLVERSSHQSVYYCSAVLGLIWSLIYLCLIHEKPRDHPRISKEELIHIEQGLSNAKYEDDKCSTEDIPWRSIFRSLPVWSICLAHFGRGWTFYFLLTNQPSFLKAFGFEMKEIGLFGSLPYFVKVIVGLSSGFLADLLKLKYSWSTTNIRKLMTCSGYFIQASSLLVLSMIDNRTMIIVLLTVGVGFSGLMVSGWHLNHQDLSPRYSSVLAGFTSIFGTTAAVLSPIVAGYLTREQTLDGWRHVFIIICSILYFCAIFYYLFSSGELQSWSNGRSVEHKVRLDSERFGPILNSFEHKIQNRFGSSVSSE